jgi:hypothetical protein
MILHSLTINTKPFALTSASISPNSWATSNK